MAAVSGQLCRRLRPSRLCCCIEMCLEVVVVKVIKRFANHDHYYYYSSQFYSYRPRFQLPEQLFRFYDFGVVMVGMLCD